MDSSNLKHLTLALVLSVVSLGILTACVRSKSETVTTSSQTQPATPIKSPYQPQVQPETFSGPPSQPNMILDVKRQAGACPKTVGIWTFMLPFEGGAEHTAVAETRSIAQTAKLVTEGKHFVEYEAPLQDKYASCVGNANSKSPKVYNFQFRDGKVYFRVALKQLTVPGEITYQGIGAFRPYVRWNTEN